MRLRSITIFVFFTLAAAGLAIAQTPPISRQIPTNDGPAITFTDTTVSCSGLSPGDSVALAGYVIDRTATYQTITTPTISQLADANGVFTATIPGGVKPRSIWLLINETSSSYTVAAPERSSKNEGPALRLPVGTRSSTRL